LLALKTGNAALLASPDASCDIVATVVFALGAAGLLMDPETAEELRTLRAARPADEDPIAYALIPEALHASSGAVSEIARQAEDRHDSPLHHDYSVGRDLPEVTP
jgi:hypothetical protein